MTAVRAYAGPLAVLVLLAACAAAAPAGGELLGDRYDLRGAHVRLATRDFTEALVLGQIAAQAWRAAGATVTLTENVPGPTGVREALLAGDVDAVWDYTGAVWVTTMGNAPIRDPAAQYDAVVRVDRRRNDLVWSRPASFDSTFGIATRRRFAADRGLRGLHDVARFVQRRPERSTLCVDQSFAVRRDGLPAFERTYGVSWPDDALVVLPAESIAPATARGAPCVFGQVTATDGRLPSLGLTVPADTGGAFVSYVPGVQVSADVAVDHPHLLQVVDDVVTAIDASTIAALNAAVDIGDAYPEDVAARYLRDRGFIE